MLLAVNVSALALMTLLWFGLVILRVSQSLSLCILLRSQIRLSVDGSEVAYAEVKLCLDPVAEALL